MRLTNWAFATILAACGCLWIWATIDARRRTAAAEAFYAGAIIPDRNAYRSNLDAVTESSKQRRRGEIVPLPPVRTPSQALTYQWESLIQARNRSARVRDQAYIGLMATVLAWTVFALVRGFGARLAWESAGRQAIPTAGKIVGKLAGFGSVFVARTDDAGVGGPQVEIDGSRSVAVFRNLTFVTAFAGNPKRARTEVPFSDLIVGTLGHARGGSFLMLRTAQGRVTITDKIKPFKELVALLQDAAELNRTSPDRFRDALSREPVVRTPWYGWAIIGAALAAAGTACWWFAAG